MKEKVNEKDLRAAPLERVHAGLVLSQAIGDSGGAHSGVRVAEEVDGHVACGACCRRVAVPKGEGKTAVASRVQAWREGGEGGVAADGVGEVRGCHLAGGCIDMAAILADTAATKLGGVENFGAH